MIPTTSFPLAQIESDEENWDDVEIPSSGLIITDNISDVHTDDDVGKILSTATDDMSGITIVDSDDDAGNILSSTVAFDQKSLFTSTNKNLHLLDDTKIINNLNASNSSTHHDDDLKVVKAIIGDLTNSLSNNEFSGTITKLGGDNSKKVLHMDDWDNDMEIPEAVDVPTSISRLSSEKIVESFDQDFDLLDMNDLNLSTDALKIKYSYESFDDLQIPDSIEKLTLFPPRHVQDGNAFEPVHKNIVPRSIPTQQKRPRRQSFTIKFTPPSISNSIPPNSTSDSLNSFMNVDLSHSKDSFHLKDSSHSKDSSLSSEKSSTSTNNSSISSNNRSSPSLSKKVSKKNCNSSFVTPSPSPNKIVSHSKKDTNVISKRPSTVSPKTSSSPPLKKCNTKSIIKNSTTSKSRTTSTLKTSNSNVTGNVKENFNPSLKSKKSTTSTKSLSTTKSINSARLSKMASSPSLKSSNLSGSSPLTKHANNSSISLTSPTHSRVKSAPMSISVTSSVNKTNSKIQKIQKNSASKTLRIMLKPNNSQNYGDGTELDAFDDLPICLDKERAYKKYPTSPGFDANSGILSNRKNSASSIGSKTSTRSNTESRMNSNSSKKKNRQKKPHLIRNLNSETNSKVIGEMVYNPVLQRWDGNESILKDFDPSPQRPALISNMNPQSTNTKSLQVVGKMIFDPVKMCWFHYSAKDNNNSMSSEEEELLALFDSEEEIDLENTENIEIIENTKNTDNLDESSKFKFHTSYGETFGMNNDGNDELWNGLASASLVFSDGDHNEIVCSAEGRRRRRIIPSGNGNKQTNDTNGDGFDDNNEFQVGSEFDVSKGFLAALMASERQHKKEMNRWYPAIRSIRNEQRFGLKDSICQRGFLYEIKNPAIVNSLTALNSGKQHRKSISNGTLPNNNTKSSISK
ncbi:7265_t:CDS:10 [Cetraspora pellucida]|uniref:7265_t:CDS:1 n=1 Tax=Cetraspora pellucida TaxID=1433469 RepID=A0A9N9FCT4_9GLOM|nr:7265_t:CDS:10 [Cetraspora pellucida]